MAKGMRDIKRQIKSVQNTKQITKAMEMIAASRLKRAQAAAVNSRPYAEKMREVIGDIAAGSRDEVHPMLQAREIKKTGYLVITSDRGLAGGYNANLLRMVTRTIESKHKSADDYVLYVVGRKGRDYFKRRNMPIAGEVVGLPDTPRFLDIQSVAFAAVKQFEDGGCDELVVAFNEFISTVSQKPVEKRLLPLEEIKQDGQIESWEYEPSPEAVLAALLPKYAETLVFSAVLEAKASEFGARMAAMGNASRNADEMISGLTLQYNRARQASITQEISEIVAGANAQV